MKAVNNTTDFTEVIEQDKPVLLDFYADWCGPCQTLLPTVERLATEFDGKIEVRKVNVDQHQELAAQFQVRSIPALFFLKDATVIDRIQGVVSESALRQKMESIQA